MSEREERSLKAVVFHDLGDIRLEDVPEPEIQQPTDAVGVDAEEPGSDGSQPFVTQVEHATDAVSAFEEFGRREPGWLKVVLDPSEVTAA